MTSAYGVNRFGKVSERKYCPTCWKKKAPKQMKGQRSADQKVPDEASTLFVGGVLSAGKLDPHARASLAPFPDM